MTAERFRARSGSTLHVLDTGAGEAAARGRTLLLIDGGRVTSERRVGPSATVADPSLFEGIDVARGPGSVAYGSDALGGIISVRTRRAEPGSPLQVRASGTLGGGIPDRRGVATNRAPLVTGVISWEVRGVSLSHHFTSAIRSLTRGGRAPVCVRPRKW